MNGRREGVTHAIPESEASLDFGLRILDPRERLLANLQRHRLGLLHALGIGISYPLTIIDMRQRVQIHFSQDAKSGIDFALEGEGEIDVEEVFAILPGVVAEEHVQGSDFEQGSERAGE